MGHLIYPFPVEGSMMTSGTIPSAALSHLQDRSPWLWLNARARAYPADVPEVTRQVAEARDRLRRSERLIRALFKLSDTGYPPIYSPLLPITGIEPAPTGPWFVKADHALPIAGSIKARGGFHEVIAHAERLAIQNDLIEPGQDLVPLASSEARNLFAQHSVVVGSTGNLGLSIGLFGAALGFRAVVHMSTDAKAWKKQRLRDHGATVVEHAGDYGEAVARGRAIALGDPSAYFVDDEKSADLFSGYACAAYELADQLAAAGVLVDSEHPLIVYLPCGVGGAPGGITYGLKLIFGPQVHCFFAEPTDSPCMLVQMLSEPGKAVSVYDIALTNRTELDGLAVGAASMFVAPLLLDRLAGIYTIGDAEAFDWLRRLHSTCGIDVEPSAATALAGPSRLTDVALGSVPKLSQATHVSWTTGGSLVPSNEFQAYLSCGSGQ
ncbi:D-serine ammonia-lyase [Mesorhizobium sp. M1156]|uniref:D-serine ammonia-lyase n=1 Tax=Mesorhizobium sp. M1156 TaxID=2957064 RepID=UPI003334D16A